MELKDKCFIIVGGTSGMGLSTALSLYQQGAKLAIIGKKDNNLNPAKEFLPKQIIVGGDATDPSIVEETIARAHRKMGPIHGLYHVAGGSGRKFGDGPLHELSLDGWEQTLKLNLTSVMLSNQAIIRYFLKNKIGGNILNMGSVLANSPSPKYFSTHAYAAAKSAIIGFSKSIASYYASHDIRVNVIAPGLVQTPMSQRATMNDDIQAFIKTKQPLMGGGIGHADELDRAAIMLLAPSNKSITGQVLNVDRGWSVSEGQYENS